MTEHKFTDEEVIKALEHCGSGYQGDVAERCFECPLDMCGEANCFDTLLHDLSLDLINRQKAEIEEKSKRLREVLPIVAELKAEAIKEFAERLKNYEGVVTDLGNGVVLRAVNSKHIDGLLKEMLGGNVCETNTETERSHVTE